MKVLILGAAGQLGMHFRKRMPEALFWTRTEADFLDVDLLKREVVRTAPDVIINAAAYTAVDQAEEESEVAEAINTLAPAALAAAAQEIDALLIHFSTDYVFDGSSIEPYENTDIPNPLGVYGKTKLAGEGLVSTNCERFWIFRISWLFSEYGTNFVKTILRLAESKTDLEIVSDQTGTPTYAGDVAGVVTQLLETKELPSGIYHLSGGAKTNWFQFARRIFAEAQYLDNHPTLTPVTAEEYPTKASRPSNSVLVTTSDLAQFLTNPPNWKQGLRTTIENLADAR